MTDIESFHLAEATGVAISYVGTVGTVRTAPQILTQARAYNKVTIRTPATHSAGSKLAETPAAYHQSCEK